MKPSPSSPGTPNVPSRRRSSSPSPPIALSAWKTLPLDRGDDHAWPKTISSKDRLTLYDTCGESCFVVEPSTTDPSLIKRQPSKYLKFPICRPPEPDHETPPPCRVSPSGVKAARRRAILTRSRVGSRYDAVVDDTSQYIASHHLTLKSKQQMGIVKVRLRTVPTCQVSLVYEDGSIEPYRTLSPTTIHRLYRRYMTPRQRQRLAEIMPVRAKRVRFTEKAPTITT